MALNQRSTLLRKHPLTYREEFLNTMSNSGKLLLYVDNDTEEGVMLCREFERTAPRVKFIDFFQVLRSFYAQPDNINTLLRELTEVGGLARPTAYQKIEALLEVMINESPCCNYLVSGFLTQPDDLAKLKEVFLGDIKVVAVDGMSSVSPEAKKIRLNVGETLFEERMNQLIPENFSQEKFEMLKGPDGSELAHERILHFFNHIL